MSSHHNMGSKDRRRRKQTLLQRYGNVCYYCGCVTGKDNLQMDHIVPRSRGGTNAVSNLVLSCESCNKVKSNKFLLPEEVKQRKKAIYDDYGQ
jgi:5-methylcytosine-specific restriction endonuclease McrA